MRNPHLLTIAGNFWPRSLDVARFPVEERCFETEPGVSVLCLSQQPAATPLGHLILLHGLEGSAEGGYMRSMAQAGLEAGFAVHRLNTRGCGGTERLSNTLYHAGLTSDLLHVLRRFRNEERFPVILVGFSLGGNIALKLAGELGPRARELFGSVCAISTPIDLARCVRRLDEPQNWIYQQRFVSRMKQRLLERHRLMPERFSIRELARTRTVYEFDNLLTAPAFGFGNADHYYATQSAKQFLSRIETPTILIQAIDDPLVPHEMFEDPAIVANSEIELMSVEHGGHLGFLSAGKGPRFWLDQAVLSWISSRNNRAAAAVWNR